MKTQTKIDLLQSLATNLRNGYYDGWSEGWQNDSKIDSEQAKASAIDFLECRIIELEEEGEL